MTHYCKDSDETVDGKIDRLPRRLKEIFDSKVKEGLNRRHALFIASSYDWRDENYEVKSSCKI